MKGVNLGGWLVLEKWVTPSLFASTDAADEYTFMQTHDAQQKIEAHRKTFITEADFEWLADHAIEAVRIPVGYWVFSGDTPYTPTISYLDWAVATAKKYNLKVLIDLHAAPGSQNGKDHSGSVGKAMWYKRKDYREETIAVLMRLAEHYKYEPTVWGLELLNEPKIGLIQWKLRRFYKQAYKEVTAVGREGLVVVFHDAFTPRLLTAALNPLPNCPVMMDIHWYHFLDPFHKWRPVAWYLRKVKNRRLLIRRLQAHQPVLIGEWSLVMSGEATRKHPEIDNDEYMKRHSEAQLTAYQEAAGWFYWTYKTESLGVWHFRSLVEKGIISLK